MFKKLSYLFVLLPSMVFAGVLGDTLVGTQSSNITIAAPGAGKVNCLTHVSFDVSVQGGSSATFRILDGNTTNYQLITSTVSGFVTVLPFTDQSPWCGSMNSAIQLKNTATTFDINYLGYVKNYSGQ